MDPNIALADIRRQLDLAERAPSLAQANVHRENACAAMRGLDEWISNGGFFPSEWTEAQRRALENVRPARCERPTLAGTSVPAPCPPSAGAYDDPAVQRAIAEHLHTNPWDGR